MAIRPIRWPGLAFVSMAAAMVMVPTVSPALEAQITRTRYGIPHVLASDWAGLGFGTAYAFAEDNVCLLADHLVTLSGQRSKYFGADATVTVAFQDIRNLDSDAYFRGTFDGAALRQAVRSTSREYRELIRGYVAGYNEYLRRIGSAHLPAACRNAAWVRPMRDIDALRLNEDKMRLASGERLASAIVGATPPTEPVASAVPVADGVDAWEAITGRLQVEFGSNGWAFGAETTGGAGVLLGNPHFPWTTTNRFWQVHQTIPGKLDVMGVTLSGLPSVVIGFNRNVAWTHTVSTDRHFTYFELALDPKDPTVYHVDGRPVRMETRTVSIEVKGGPPVRRTIYRSMFGPIFSVPALGLGWTREHAYALKDADELNFRAPDAWLRVERADSVAGILRAITEPVGIPWVNTIAADRHGDVLYADVTPTPNVTDQTPASCLPAKVNAPLAKMRLYVLDGTTAACDWSPSPKPGQDGLLPASRMPRVLRRDFVANSNDSFWLANDVAPLRDVPEIVGRVDEPQGLRTRNGLKTIHAAIAGRQGAAGAAIGPSAVKEMVFRNHNLAAELALDDVLSICRQSTDALTSDGKPVSLADACAVLSRWDRRMDLDSRGAALWVELWAPLARSGAGYPAAAVAFDPKDAVSTPRGLSLESDNPAHVRTALADAVTLLASRGVALDARWGDVQKAVRGERRIPIHGGPGSNGVLNMQEAAWTPGVGYVPVHGSSYVQVVTFDEAGPVVDAVLTYSQSTDPASAHFYDQTELYSRKEWNRLPFSAESIGRQQVSREFIRH